MECYKLEGPRSSRTPVQKRSENCSGAYVSVGYDVYRQAWFLATWEGKQDGWRTAKPSLRYWRVNVRRESPMASTSSLDRRIGPPSGHLSAKAGAVCCFAWRHSLQAKVKSVQRSLTPSYSWREASWRSGGNVLGCCESCPCARKHLECNGKVWAHLSWGTEQGTDEAFGQWTHGPRPWSGHRYWEPKHGIAEVDALAPMYTLPSNCKRQFSDKEEWRIVSP